MSLYGAARYQADEVGADQLKKEDPALPARLQDPQDEARRAHHANAGAEAQAIEREGERILAAIPDGAVVVVLDVRGKELSSEKLAARLHEWQMAGVSPVVFVIGGDLGISRAVLARADLRLSLSPMTFTHQMVRMIILEQIYRACRINSGEPYHK